VKNVFYKPIFASRDPVRHPKQSVKLQYMWVLRPYRHIRTHVYIHKHTVVVVATVVASVVEQEVAGELEKRQRKRWYWRRCRMRC